MVMVTLGLGTATGKSAAKHTLAQLDEDVVKANCVRAPMLGKPNSAMLVGVFSTTAEGAKTLTSGLEPTRVTVKLTPEPCQVPDRPLLPDMHTTNSWLNAGAGLVTTGSACQENTVAAGPFCTSGSGVTALKLPSAPTEQSVGESASTACVLTKAAPVTVMRMELVRSA